MKALQLILRHQIWFLTHEKGLPAELETVVFDLWALRILQFGDKISEDNEELHSSQAFSSIDDDAEAVGDGPRFGKRERKFKGIPGLIDCLALCYLGITTLRLPVTPGDIYAWTAEGKMAYLGAIKYLPPAMRDRLPANYHAVLDPNALLRFERFYPTLIALQVGFEKEYAILWPPLNAPLLLFRYLKELALPLELYDATLRLGKLLDYDFAFHTDGKKRLGVRDLPEAQLLACFVMCVKLFYPFDGQRRYPTSTSELATSVVNWEAWCRQMDLARLKGRPGTSSYTPEELLELEKKDLVYTTEELFKLEVKDVLSMSEEQLDQYMDFYLANFLDETHIEPNQNKDDFRNKLYEWFPATTETPAQPRQALDEDNSEAKLEVVRAVQSSMKLRPAVAEEAKGTAILRPGQAYKKHKKEERLPELQKRFYEEAARVAGLSLNMLVMAVSSTETRVENWRSTQRKGKKLLDERQKEILLHGLHDPGNPQVQSTRNSEAHIGVSSIDV